MDLQMEIPICRRCLVPMYLARIDLIDRTWDLECPQCEGVDWTTKSRDDGQIAHEED